MMKIASAPAPVRAPTVEPPEVSTQLLDLAGAPCFTCTPDGLIARWSAGAEALYGFSHREALRANCHDLLQTTHAPDPHRLRAILEREGRWTGIVHRVTRDGFCLLVEARLQLQRDAGGNTWILEADHDLTEQRRHEQALRESEERFARSFRNSPIGLVLTHPDTNVIVDANDAFLRIIGHPRHAVLGHNTIDLGLVPDLEYRAPLLSELRERGSFRDRQLRVAARGGQMKDLLLDGQLVELDGTRYILTMIRDVTAAKQAESELLAAHEFTQQIVAFAREGIVVIDAAGRISVWNRFMEQLTGYSQTEMLGFAAKRFFTDDRFPGFAEHLDHVNDGESFTSPDLFIALAEKRREFWTVYSIAPLLDHDHRTKGAIVTMHDITPRKQLEHRLINIVEREKQRISQDLHDDLGQQLTAITIMVDKVRSQCCHRSTGAVTDLDRVSDLLAQSHRNIRSIVRGLQPVAPHPHGLMEALEALARTETAATGLQVCFECTRSIAVRNPAVAMQLFRIAKEAVNNAAKHARARRVKILLGRHRHELRLEITDDGCGLPRESGHGPGAGLRIMRYRAESIGGQIELSRRKRRGTLVSCRVHLARSNEAITAAS